MNEPTRPEPFAPTDDETDDELLQRLTFINGAHALPDDMLQRFVEVINGDLTKEVGLTLMIGGSLVSGTGIPQPVYIDELLAFYLANETEPIEEGLWDDFKVPVGREELDQRAPRFIHFRNAHVKVGPSGWMTMSLARFRISHVSGWTIGEFRPPTD